MNEERFRLEAALSLPNDWDVTDKTLACEHIMDYCFFSDTSNDYNAQNEIIVLLNMT